MLTLGVPDCARRAEGAGRPDLTLPYNDFEAATELFDKLGDERRTDHRNRSSQRQLLLPPRYLQDLRICAASTARCSSSMSQTGFRVRAGGAQQRYGITPDLSTSANHRRRQPVGAYGRRAD